MKKDSGKSVEARQIAKERKKLDALEDHFLNNPLPGGSAEENKTLIEKVRSAVEVDLPSIRFTETDFARYFPNCVFGPDKEAEARDDVEFIEEMLELRGFSPAQINQYEAAAIDLPKGWSSYCVGWGNSKKEAFDYLVWSMSDFHNCELYLYRVHPLSTPESARSLTSYKRILELLEALPLLKLIRNDMKQNHYEVVQSSLLGRYVDALNENGRSGVLSREALLTRNRKSEPARGAAEKLAKELWETDTEQEYRVGDLAGVIWDHLSQSGSPEVKLGLPKNRPGAVTKWIRPLAPEYAKKPGREPKKK